MANTKVTSRVLANDAVLTANIADDQVTTAKIADDQITSALVADDLALGGNPTTTTQSAGNNTTRIATTAFVTTAVANIVDSAPSALDTLNELAAALGDDANFSTTITNSIAAKLPLAGGTMTGGLGITVADNSDNLTLTSTDEDANDGANLRLYRNSASPADNDFLGHIQFEGRNDNSQDVIYAELGTQLKDASDGTEDGRLMLNTMVGGTLRSRISIDPTEVVINEEGLSTLDFRVESDSKANAFLVDASANRIGIGTGTPQAHLDINTETAEATTVILNGEINQDKILKFRHHSNSEGAGDGYAGFIGSVVDNVLTLGHYNSSNTEVQALHVTEGGNVGIGTDSPSRVLHTEGASVLFGTTSGAHEILFGDSAYRYFKLYTPSSPDYASIRTGTTDILVAHSNGNVGIGTTNPAGTLHVQMTHTSTDVTAANSNETLVLGNSGTGNGVYNAIKFGGNQQDMYIMSFNNSAQADRRMGFFLGSVAGDAVADERLSIKGDGNVGIGETSPAATLHVKRADGTALIVESSNDQNNTGDRINIEFKTDADQGIAKIIGGKEGNYQSQGARSGYLAFQTINANSYAERMRISSAGHAFFGCTALPSGGAGGAAFETGQSSGRSILQLGTTSTGSLAVARFYNGNGGVGNITLSGTSTAFNTSSDYRLKENIRPIENGLERLNKLKPVKFDWITDGTSSEGFIAHEAQEVFPDAVSGEKDDEEMQGMDYGRITPLLVKAIQEQQEQIETLKKEVEELKGG